MRASPSIWVCSASLLCQRSSKRPAAVKSPHSPRVLTDRPSLSFGDGPGGGHSGALSPTLQSDHGNWKRYLAPSDNPREPDSIPI